MIKEKKSLKGKAPSRRKFFKTAAATGVAAVAATSLSAPAVAKAVSYTHLTLPTKRIV